MLLMAYVCWTHQRVCLFLVLFHHVNATIIFVDIDCSHTTDLSKSFDELNDEISFAMHHHFCIARIVY